MNMSNQFNIPREWMSRQWVAAQYVLRQQGPLKDMPSINMVVPVTVIFIPPRRWGVTIWMN